MQDPLKQGLKLQLMLLAQDRQFIIRMQDPLKQGLKLVSQVQGFPPLSDSNARSTKTRIETVMPRKRKDTDY